jgi:hypothetical protein
LQHGASEVGPRARLFCFSQAICFTQDRRYLLIGHSTQPHRPLAEEEPSLQKSLVRRNRAGHGSAIRALNDEWTNSSRMGTSAIEQVVRRTSLAETGSGLPGL